MQRLGKIMTKNGDSDNSRVVELHVHFFKICIFKMFYNVCVSQACSDSNGCQHRRSVIQFAPVQKGLYFSLIGKVLRSGTSERPACLWSLSGPPGYVHP